MTAAARVCTECGTSLSGRAPTTKTCSKSCRQKRARRVAHDNASADRVASVARIVDKRDPDITRKAVNEALIPVVREAIDGSVLEAINKMVGLTPKAVEVLAEQLHSPDPERSFRAAALVAKYTVGHPALVKPADKQPAGLQVNIGLPRPSANDDNVDVSADADIQELKVCAKCGLEKPEDAFPAGGPRCSTCFEQWRDAVLSTLDD